MKTTMKKIVTFLAAVFLLGAVGTSHAAPPLIDVTFGSDNAGYGGFQTVANFGDWSEQTTSIRYSTNLGGKWAAAGLYTELSGENALSTAAGSRYTFTSVIDCSTSITAESASFGMRLFSNTCTSGGISATLSITKAFTVGSTSANWDGLAAGEGTFTFEATVTFTETHADVSFTLTDSADHSQTIATSIL